MIHSQLKYLVASLFLMLFLMGCDRDYRASDPNTNPYYMPEHERSVWKNGTSANNKEIWQQRQRDSTKHEYK